ncbi:MAG: hypothetical protein KGZ39_07680 [Simkania sp.]|nr:hypothetical protein [Simkania sp.]
MNLSTLFSYRHLTTIGCAISGSLAIFSAISFFYQATIVYRNDRTLSSIERDLPKLTAFSQAKHQAETMAQKADPKYLEKHLSSLQFLNLERGSLELLEKKNVLNEQAAKRLYFLRNDNTIHLQTHKKITTGLCREIKEILSHPIEIDEKDLPSILEELEGKETQLEKPPLRIYCFSLEKKETSPHYTLYFELWRKELL